MMRLKLIKYAGALTHREIRGWQTAMIAFALKKACQFFRINRSTPDKECTVFAVSLPSCLYIQHGSHFLILDIFIELPCCYLSLVLPRPFKLLVIDKSMNGRPRHIRCFKAIEPFHLIHHHPKRLVIYRVELLKVLSLLLPITLGSRIGRLGWRASIIPTVCPLKVHDEDLRNRISGGSVKKNGNMPSN